jgi:putative pyruvate formate lyase activating enzyme
MYWFLRPDAARAFEDRGVKHALGRYVSVAANEKQANFRIAQLVPVSFSERDSDEKLWKLHTEKLKDYERLKEELDSGKRDYASIAKPEKSLLHLKRTLAWRMLSACEFCERRCKRNRRKGEIGFCGVAAEARLSSEFLHMGEEACLVPSHTFFFIGCNFYCVYCQNWMISRQVEKGLPVTGEYLAELAKKRRLGEGSRNVNLVGGSPTPSLHVILDMLLKLDVNVPIVWNSNMYMSSEAMSLLHGVVDVYLGDFKYGNDECAMRFSKVPRYFEVVTRNFLLAREQGAELLIRHLVLPNHVECCTREILEWIAENLENKARVNIMGQFRPEFEAYKHADISRRVTGEEMGKALAIAKELGLWNLD